MYGQKVHVGRMTAPQTFPQTLVGGTTANVVSFFTAELETIESADRQGTLMKFSNGSREQKLCTLKLYVMGTVVVIQ